MASQSVNLAPRRSLVEMCIKVAIDNIQKMNSLTGVPPRLVSDILRAVKSAHQLHQFETRSEDIYDETPPHWRRIIAKDFPKLSQEHQWVPSNPKSWYKVWKKYKKIQDESVAAATEALAQTFAAQQKEKDSKRTQVVLLGQARMLALPSLGKGVLRNVGGSSGGSTSHWSSQPPRPKPTPLSRVKTQVKAEAKRLKLATPTGSLVVRPGQIAKAPDSMIRDKRIERQFDPASTLAREPRQVVRPFIDIAERARDRERKEREERLLRIKNISKPPENVVNFDDDDDEHVDNSGGGMLDDLFGELEASAASSPSPESSSPVRQTSRPRGASHSPAKPASISLGAGIPGTSTASVPPSRRRGLLSAAPGLTKVTKVTRAVTSPPASTSPPANNSPPPVKLLPRSAPGLSPTASAPPASNFPIQKRKPVVDIFMRPRKRPRN